jgi:hypothetical protein
MEISRTLLQSIYDNTVGSIGYKTTVGPVDKGKVTKAAAGLPAARPSARLAKAAFDAARTLNPIQPPPPPPPAYVKVAPRVAYKDTGSDARYCTVNQPGVVPDPSGGTGDTKDESGATYDSNGLCKNGVRSDGPAVTSAREIDGRPYCSLPTMGTAENNTGSWAI